MRLVLSLMFALLLLGCSRPDDETRIRDHIDNMSKALSAADARAFMAPLAEDFNAETWDLDRRAVQLLLLREFSAHERIRARVFDIELESLDDGRASIRFQAVVTGGRGMLPEQGAWYRVSSGWRKVGNDWELISARWEQVAGRSN